MSLIDAAVTNGETLFTRPSGPFSVTIHCAFARAAGEPAGSIPGIGVANVPRLLLEKQLDNVPSTGL